MPASRLLRDAKLYEIGAGTSEIRRMVIGRVSKTCPETKAPLTVSRHLIKSIAASLSAAALKVRSEVRRTAKVRI